MAILDEAGRVRPAIQGTAGAANLLTYAEAANHG
jgi:ethanolamine ammonia-lyase large subunit